jgi:hypothetical protein
MGVGFAFEPGRGRTALPVRSALAVTVVAIAAMSAALTFGTNLTRLVGTPRLYGQTWDLAVDTQFGNMPAGTVDKFLRQQAGVEGWTIGDHLELSIGGRRIPTIGLAPGNGAQTWPSLLEGRTPQAPDEIVLGTKTLEAVHRKVGQTIQVASQGESTSRPMRVVGRAVFPFFGRGSFSPTGLGEGAAVQDPAPNPAGFNFILVRYRPGFADSAHTARLRDDLRTTGVCPGDQECGVSTAQRPVEISNYARIKNTPLALAGVVAVLAAATFAHFLLTSIRRRRRDLAILKMLGFVRGQVSAAVAWQATVFVGSALLVGIPLGAAAGRYVWTVFASNLGAGREARVPALALAAVPVALLLANAIAAGPAWIAGRLRPATVLRTE